MATAKSQKRKAAHKLIDTGVQIAMESPEEAEKAFLGRQLIQTTLPHRDPGDVPIWRRYGRGMTLTIQQGYNRDSSPIGHPYGSKARILMAFLNTEAVRTGSRRIELGENLSELVRELGYNPRGGGVRSDRVTFMDQAKRLFNATIGFEAYIEKDGKRGTALGRMLVAEGQVLWWDPKDQEQRPLWQSYVVLDKRFHEAITSNPVPLNMKALLALRKSPLAIDLYAFLAYESFLAQLDDKPRFHSWQDLDQALGTGYADLKHLSTAVKDCIAMVKVVYPKLRLDEDARGGLKVLPESTPSIARSGTEVW